MTVLKTQVEQMNINVKKSDLNKGIKNLYANMPDKDKILLLKIINQNDIKDLN